MKAGLGLYLKLFALPLLLTATVAFNFLVWGINRVPQEFTWHVPAADSVRGALLMHQYGCGGCHLIPGVPGAQGKVGPNLKHFTQRVYIAGVVPNSPQNLVVWIQDPKRIDSRTAMPDLAVGPQDARDMAAYLYGQASP